jgi:hypothetical protein
MTSDSKAAQPRSKNETRVSINSESNKQMPCICLDGAGAVVINQLQENLWRVMRQLTARTRLASQPGFAQVAVVQRTCAYAVPCLLPAAGEAAGRGCSGEAEERRSRTTIWRRTSCAVA